MYVYIFFINKSRAAKCYEKIIVVMILASYFNAAKDGPNSTIFLNDLPIIFESVHQNLYLSYKLTFYTIFGKPILFRDPTFPMGKTKTL